MLLFFLVSSLLSASFAVPSAGTIDNFKARNAIVPDANLDLQELQGDGLLTTSAGFIDITKASPYSVSPGRSSVMGRLSRGITSSGLSFLVVRDTKFHIRRVVVRLDDGSITTFRRVDDSLFFAEVSQDVARTIVTTRTGVDAMEIPSRRLRSLSHDTVPAHQDDRELQTTCSEFFEIEVAIAYDTTFCDEYTNQAEADATVENIVAEASLHFEKPGLCTQLTLIRLESNCDAANDPYYAMFENGTGNSGCNNDGMLKDFAAYWDWNKSSVHRDVAHLFQGRDFTDGANTAGCAWIKSLCDHQQGYGASMMNWAADESVMAALFAHELGHNCAAQHVPTDPLKSYIMESPFNIGTDSFSAVSASTMVNYFNNGGARYCVSKVPAPTPSPIPAPSGIPSGASSETPSVSPTVKPSIAPANTPSVVPTSTPSAHPTEAPSVSPVSTPSSSPTEVPSVAPTHTPSALPTGSPTDAPTEAPSDTPTNAPAVGSVPTGTPIPVASPVTSPTLLPV